ncbi:MAG: hypothetical protein V2A66_10065 [Pseudomonadota bacterium]
MFNFDPIEQFNLLVDRLWGAPPKPDPAKDEIEQVRIYLENRFGVALKAAHEDNGAVVFKNGDVPVAILTVGGPVEVNRDGGNFIFSVKEIVAAQSSGHKRSEKNGKAEKLSSAESGYCSEEQAACVMPRRHYEELVCRDSAAETERNAQRFADASSMTAKSKSDSTNIPKKDSAAADKPGRKDDAAPVAVDRALNAVAEKRLVPEAPGEKALADGDSAIDAMATAEKLEQQAFESAAAMGQGAAGADAQQISANPFSAGAVAHDNDRTAAAAVPASRGAAGSDRTADIAIDAGFASYAWFVPFLEFESNSVPDVPSPHGIRQGQIAGISVRGDGERNDLAAFLRTKSHSKAGPGHTTEGHPFASGRKRASDGVAFDGGVAHRNIEPIACSTFCGDMDAFDIAYAQRGVGCMPPLAQIIAWIGADRHSDAEMRRRGDIEPSRERGYSGDEQHRGRDGREDDRENGQWDVIPELELDASEAHS